MPLRSIVHTVNRGGVRRLGCEPVIILGRSICPLTRSVVHGGLNDSSPRVSGYTRSRRYSHIVLHTLHYRVVGPHEAEAAYPYSQLIYVGRGTLTVHCGGGSHELASRQLCLIRPMEKYHVSASAGTICGILNIGAAFGLSPERSMKDHSPWQRVDIESLQGLASGFERVTAALDAADRVGVAEIRRFVLGMLARIIDREIVMTAGTPGIEQTGNLVAKIRLLLAQNADRSYGIRKLAQLLGRSDRHLSRVFKDAVGVTIKAYHERMRMNIAVDLLVTTDLHMTDIASELGFNSIHDFSRRFKTVFKISPLWFRQEAALAETAPKRQGRPTATNRSHLSRPIRHQIGAGLPANGV